MAEELVIQEALGKQFGENVIAVEDATSQFQWFIYFTGGTSGCGKSTLLRLISGLIEKSGGDLLVRNAEVVGPRSDIGMMFQKAVLLDWRTSIRMFYCLMKSEEPSTQMQKKEHGTTCN